eukprot:scaffold51246_cov22-Tisochrysis_lutea.AAC.2
MVRKQATGVYASWGCTSNEAIQNGKKREEGKDPDQHVVQEVGAAWCAIVFTCLARSWGC